jgi:hypothetical protein
MAASSSSDTGGAIRSPLRKNRSIAPRFDLAASLRWVRRGHGVGVLRQVGQALALSRRVGMTHRAPEHHCAGDGAGHGRAARRMSHLPVLPRVCHLFPRHGVPGFEAAFTPEGPVIGEVNSLPQHHNGQPAAPRGLMHADVAPRSAAATAGTERRTARTAAEADRVTSGRH